MALHAIQDRRLTEYSHGAGCACKLSPLELRAVLGALPAFTTPEVLAGTADRDDAAVYRLDEHRAAVATVDFFTPIVDDPEAFGAIAAANSLSDVYAVGGRPLFALSLVCFPRQSLSTGILEQIVRGGAAKLQEAGVPVVGGHSVDDPEPKFGYAITGEVDPASAVSHSGAQAGDLLYLTKPLGTGVVTTAIKRGIAPADVVDAAIRVMTHLNRRASEAMLAATATSATDVTGYGLVGHLVNLRGGARVHRSRVPFLPGVRELADSDVFPSGTRRNLQAVQGRVDWHDTGETERLLLSDAQTSGGLLVTIPTATAATFEQSLADEPYAPVCIGEVTAGSLIEVVD